jgi:hypothetical protein
VNETLLDDADQAAVGGHGDAGDGVDGNRAPRGRGQRQADRDGT